jgi:hypothetical protein
MDAKPMLLMETTKEQLEAIEVDARTVRRNAGTVVHAQTNHFHLVQPACRKWLTKWRLTETEAESKY